MVRWNSVITEQRKIKDCFYISVFVFIFFNPAILGAEKKILYSIFVS